MWRRDSRAGAELEKDRPGDSGGSPFRALLVVVDLEAHCQLGLGHLAYVHWRDLREGDLDTVGLMAAHANDLEERTRPRDRAEAETFAEIHDCRELREDGSRRPLKRTTAGGTMCTKEAARFQWEQTRLLELEGLPLGMAGR